MRRVIKWGIPIVLALLAVVYVFIACQMAAGVTKADRKPLQHDPATYGLEVEDVTFFPRGDDLALSGWYISRETRRPTVILVHGLGVNREESETYDNGEESSDFLKISAELVKRGFDVLLFDLRGHGRSEGVRVSGGYYERDDVLGAFDFLKSRGVPPERIGVLGFSMGAATSLLAAAKEPSIRAVVADSPFANASELIAQETARKTPFPERIIPVFVPGMKLIAKLRYGIVIDELVPEKAVTRLDYPILLIHGTADTRIPFENSVRVHSAANPQSRLWLVPQAAHTRAFGNGNGEYIDRIASYFNERLGGP